MRELPCVGQETAAAPSLCRRLCFSLDGSLVGLVGADWNANQRLFEAAVDAIRPTARRLPVLRSGGSVGAVADWEPMFSICQNWASRTLIERFSASKADVAAVEFSVVVSVGMFTSLNSGSLYVPHYRSVSSTWCAAVRTRLKAENSPCRQIAEILFKLLRGCRGDHTGNFQRKTTASACPACVSQQGVHAMEAVVLLCVVYAVRPRRE